MFIISLVCSLVMLILVNFWVCRTPRVGAAAWATWPFLLLGVCPVLPLPTYLLNVILVAVVGVVCMAFAAPRRVFVSSSLVATLASYTVGAYLAVEHVQNEANLYPYESLGERLSYEKQRDDLPLRLGLLSSGEKAASFNSEQLTETENAIERDSFRPNGAFSFSPQLRQQALEKLHENFVQQFVASPSFGASRMISTRHLASASRQDTIAMSELGSPHYRDWAEKDDRRTLVGADPVRELGWLMHRDSIADFLSPTRFGYVKDRQHVAGFQSHQFNHPHDFQQPERDSERFRLRRLELVSLLKHEEPGVYVTENLPRMDELQEVPIRPLDDFERVNLRRLWQGDDLAVDQHDDHLRMLGAIRAGKQCLSCHEAQRGDLLGAFSYHFDPVR